MAGYKFKVKILTLQLHPATELIAGIKQRFSCSVSAGIYFFKGNNRITSIKCEIHSELIIKNTFLTYLTHWSAISIVDFEQINPGWVIRLVSWCIKCDNTICTQSTCGIYSKYFVVPKVNVSWKQFKRFCKYSDFPRGVFIFIVFERWVKWPF